ncbi:MAG: hypothetical protein ABI743_14420 [bacterium]
MFLTTLALTGLLAMPAHASDQDDLASQTSTVTDLWTQPLLSELFPHGMPDTLGALLPQLVLGVNNLLENAPTIVVVDGDEASAKAEATDPFVIRDAQSYVLFMNSMAGVHN